MDRLPGCVLFGRAKYSFNGFELHVGVSHEVGISLQSGPVPDLPAEQHAIGVLQSAVGRGVFTEASY